MSYLYYGSERGGGDGLVVFEQFEGEDLISQYSRQVSVAARIMAPNEEFSQQTFETPNARTSNLQTLGKSSASLTQQLMLSKSNDQYEKMSGGFPATASLKSSLRQRSSKNLMSESQRSNFTIQTEEVEKYAGMQTITEEEDESSRKTSSGTTLSGDQPNENSEQQKHVNNSSLVNRTAKFFDEQGDSSMRFVN